MRVVGDADPYKGGAEYDLARILSYRAGTETRPYDATECADPAQARPAGSIRWRSAQDDRGSKLPPHPSASLTPSPHRRRLTGVRGNGDFVHYASNASEDSACCTASDELRGRWAKSVRSLHKAAKKHLPKLAGVCFVQSYLAKESQ